MGLFLALASAVRVAMEPITDGKNIKKGWFSLVS